MPPIGSPLNNIGAQISPFKPAQGDTAAAAFQRLASYYPSNRSVSSTPAPAAAKPAATPSAPNYDSYLSQLANSYVSPVAFNPASGTPTTASATTSIPSAGYWPRANNAYWEDLYPSMQAGMSNYNGGQQFRDLLKSGADKNSLMLNRTVVPQVLQTNLAFNQAAQNEGLGLAQYAAQQQTRQNSLMSQLAAMILGS